MFDAPETIEDLFAGIASLGSEPPPENVLPSEEALSHARSKLQAQLPIEGLGLEPTIKHLREDVCPGLNASSRSSRYYGFVTGGATPAASLADNLVTAYDQNVAVHLPGETIATDVEDRALTLLCELLKLDSTQFPHRIFTTGATGSNILGLACGREHILREAAAVRNDSTTSVGEIGIFASMHRAAIHKIQILTTVPHSSLSKAASILGLGRASLIDVGLPDAPHRFDMTKLRKYIEAPDAASIVAISAAEVNSGLFATTGFDQVREIRNMADMYGAWIHVDGAMGIMGRILTSPAHQTILDGCAGLELADSITGDGHKLLNVPYDCGFFFSRHPEIALRVFSNPGAAYLATGDSDDTIISPLNVGMENSRRFRALPVYATLTAYGSDGYRKMLEKQVELSRAVASFIMDSEDFELLPTTEGTKEELLSRIFMIVMFRAKDEELSKQMVTRIKATRKIYVSGTAWQGSPACRIAVSNWRTDVNVDLPIIQSVLEDLVAAWKKGPNQLE
ncbi:pyridoxal-dependent decarboxylase [Polyplosphaeria fusca]|uniref:Pyridoxal-dependent decarboxylase n=1 Tax=Polyplosphaeria fusca TaxID=682080 RepID=A0A9P4V682_9PLEO|nr:pyridoxal-dependent decarboxylase [Polyplosphaeria fusca]